MKYLLIIGVTITIVAILIFSANSQTSPQIQSTSLPSSQPQQPVDFIASFKIITNGTTRVFTNSMYHNLSEDVYINSEDSNTVHVKKSGVTWDDFFKTLPMKLTKDCLTTGTGQTFCNSETRSLKFYIKEKLEPDALDLIINPGDVLLIDYGEIAL